MFIPCYIRTAEEEVSLFMSKFGKIIKRIWISPEPFVTSAQCAWKSAPGTENCDKFAEFLSAFKKQGL